MVKFKNESMKGKTIAVWFSCGAASAVAAKKTVEKYGENNRILIVNTFILEEDSDNTRFLRDIEKWVGVPIIYAGAKKYPSGSIREVFEKRKFMSSPYGAICTKEIKKQARYEFELENKIDFHVLGFTLEEKHRHDKFAKWERSNILPVLIEDNTTKEDCFEILIAAGIPLPAMYKMIYPNANCPGCVKSQSPTYWNHVRKMHPVVFKDRAEQSRRLGVRLVKLKGRRIFLDELPEDAIGRPLKSMKAVECGIFCDTN